MADNSVAKLAQGSLVKVGNGAGSEVFTIIPGIQRIALPDTRFDLKDVTDHDDVDFYRQYLAGLSDGEVLSLRGNWRPSNTIHIGLRNDNLNATRRNLKFVLADSGPGNTCLVSTFIQSFGGNADVGEPFGQEMRVKVVGAPIWT